MMVEKIVESCHTQGNKAMHHTMIIRNKGDSLTHMFAGHFCIINSSFLLNLLVGISFKS